MFGYQSFSSGLVCANFFHCLFDILVHFVHQFFVLGVDFIGDSQFVFHGLKRCFVPGSTTQGFDSWFSSFVQRSMGISFQVNYLWHKDQAQGSSGAKYDEDGNDDK